MKQSSFFSAHETQYGVEPVRSYPDSPGYKASGTSQEAAEAVADEATTIRDKALCVIRAHSPDGITPDEVATILRRSVLSVRPRCSELKKMGLVVPAGERSTNESGLDADKLRVP